MKLKPSELSRATVQVVLRTRTSISPDCSAVKRSLAVVGTYLTLLASPRTAAADRLAVVDVEAGPRALVVRRAESGKTDVDAAAQGTALLDGIERFRLRQSRRRQTERHGDRQANT